MKEKTLIVDSDLVSEDLKEAIITGLHIAHNTPGVGRLHNVTDDMKSDIDTNAVDVKCVQTRVDSVKNKSDRIFKLICAISAVLLATIIGMSAVIIHLSGKLNDLNTSLEALDVQTAKSLSDQQSQLNDIVDDVDVVRSDMQSGFEAQQAQIDKTKQVQHITNKALVRVNKELANKESEIEELREELKKY